ncbi:hypothetical protein ACFX1X_019713 [Malus domestica]
MDTTALFVAKKRLEESNQLPSSDKGGPTQKQELESFPNTSGSGRSEVCNSPGICRSLVSTKHVEFHLFLDGQDTTRHVEFPLLVCFDGHEE